jgi:hypothetical protein
MGIASQLFEGIATRIPGIYTSSEFPASLGSSGVAGNIVAVIGESKGGIPYNATDFAEEDRVNTLTSVTQVANELIGGNGMYMSEFYLSPTKDETLRKPPLCLFFRVNPALPGTDTLQATAVDVIELQTLLYGNIANQLSRKVEVGTTVGKKITVKFQGTTIAEEDDISLSYFEIQYTGAGSAATMTVDATSLTTTVTAGSPEEDLDLKFVDYPTIDKLIAYINEQPSFTATLKGRADAKSDTLDAVTAQDILTSAYTLLADDTDWANTLTLMKKFRINHILPATGDATIHAMINTHLDEMAKIEEAKNRSAGAGAALGKTIAEKRAEAKVIGSSRFEYWATPFKRPDILDNNASKEFDPFYAAALGAGIRFGNFTTISATFKSVNATAVTETYDKKLEADPMIGDGCSLLERTENRGIAVLHNVSTYQAENLILNLPSMLRTADHITLDSQAKLLAVIADLKRAPTALVIKSIENYLTTNLLPGYADDGYLTDDPNTGDPAFSDVEFTVSGDRFDFKFTGIIPAPLHFGFMKQKFIIVGFQGL